MRFHVVIFVIIIIIMIAVMVVMVMVIVPAPVSRSRFLLVHAVLAHLLARQQAPRLCNFPFQIRLLDSGTSEPHYLHRAALAALEKQTPQSNLGLFSLATRILFGPCRTFVAGILLNGKAPDSMLLCL